MSIVQQPQKVKNYNWPAISIYLAGRRRYLTTCQMDASPPRIITISRLYIRARQARQRRRLLTCVAVYGAALGAFALIVSLVARTKPLPPNFEPQHLDPVIAIFLSLAGIAAGGLVAWTLTLWLVQRAEYPQSPFVWIGVGLGFAIIVPFLTGALAPVSIVFLNMAIGVSETPEVLSGLADSIFRVPRATFEYGALSLGPTAIAAVLFVVGTWIIDRANTYSNVRIAEYGTYAVAAALSAAAIGFATLAPPSTIVKLG